MSARALEAPPEFFARPKPAKSDAERLQERALAAGELVEIIETDRSGRKISRFYGDPGLWLSPYAYPSKLVVGFGGGSQR